MNVGGQQIRKGTIFGLTLSILIVGLATSYFIYILEQYFTNGIEPNYREQSFISQGQINITLEDNLFGFRFEHDVNKSIQLLEKQQNKTYLVFIALFFYNDNDYYQNIQLNINECTDNNLKGYYCLDYSKVGNYSLTLGTIDNIQSQIQVFTYGCLDLDKLKTTIPDNCASQTDIDKAVNGLNAGLRLKLQTSQYNVTSELRQINFRNSFIYTTADQYILSTFKTQKQITQIKQGLFVQSQTSFSSPIQYDLQNQVLDRQYALQQVGEGPYLQISIAMDEIVQQIQVQYSTLPQVLAQVNSTIAALMLVGILGKKFSQSSLRNDFFLILLKNVFQEKYFEMLKINKFLQKQDLDEKNLVYQKYLSQQHIEENLERLEKNENATIQIPTNNYKFKQEVQKKAANDEVSNTYLYDASQDDGKQMDTTFVVQKKIDYQQIEVSQKEIFFDKKSTTDQLAINKEDSIKYLNEKCNISFDDQTRTVNGSMNLRNKCINNSFVNKISNTPELKKSYYASESSTNRFKSSNQQQNIDTNKHFSLKFVALKDQRISNQIKKIAFGTRLWKKEEFLRSQGLNTQSFKLIQDQINKDLDILELYQDIIFLKKAIMILFTTDQLAAIRLIGCSSKFLDSQILDFGKFQILTHLQNQMFKNKQENQKKVSHYEKQFAISLSDELQYKYVNKFLKRCQNSEQINQLDEKIFTSMYQTTLE